MNGILLSLMPRELSERTVRVPRTKIDRLFRQAERRINDPKTPTELAYALAVEAVLEFLTGETDEHPFKKNRRKRRSR